MQVWRPCDAVESAVSWKCAIERQDGPSTLIFSRQNLPHMPRTAAQIEAIGKGGYILKDSEGAPEAIIIATGSEVELAVKAAEVLTGKGKKIRVVSLPSTNVFEAQDQAYRDSVLPPSVAKRVVVEAGVTDELVEIRGQPRQNRRSGPLRRIGPGRPTLQRVRLYGGKCRRECRSSALIINESWLGYQLSQDAFSTKS